MLARLLFKKCWPKSAKTVRLKDWTWTRGPHLGLCVTKAFSVCKCSYLWASTELNQQAGLKRVVHNLCEKNHAQKALLLSLWKLNKQGPDMNTSTSQRQLHPVSPAMTFQWTPYSLYSVCNWQYRMHPRPESKRQVQLPFSLFFTLYFITIQKDINNN